MQIHFRIGFRGFHILLNVQITKVGLISAPKMQNPVKDNNVKNIFEI